MQAGEMPTGDLIASPRFLREASTHWAWKAAWQREAHAFPPVPQLSSYLLFMPSNGTALESGASGTAGTGCFAALLPTSLLPKIKRCLLGLAQQSLCYSFALEISL